MALTQLTAGESPSDSRRHLSVIMKPVRDVDHEINVV